MIKIPTLVDMLKAGLHFGHLTSKRHPKMAPFIFGIRSNVHIIDLEATSLKLEKALEFVTTLASEGKIILFLSTKSQAREKIKAAAESSGMPFLVNRWIGGLLTNFSQVHKVIKRYNSIVTAKESGEFAKLTKKDQAKQERELTRLEHMVGGIKDLTQIPDALFVIDIKKEKTAIAEAKRVNLPVVAVVDTNVNPELVTHPIPGNDDAIKAIELVANLVSEAVNEGKTLRKKEEAVEKEKMEKHISESK